MPSFSSSSSIRVASQDYILRLKITHNLVHGSPSGTVHGIKGRLPKGLDVLWLSDLTISLDGSLDGHQTPAHDIACSGLVHHLHAQLIANADRLGLNNVSRPFVDDADGLSKLMLTPSRPLPHASRPHANLVSLHLAYIWRTVAGRNDNDNSGHFIEQVDPFSPILFLPAKVLLNRAIEQFLVFHVVGRYPLIFGPWCKRLDLEMQYFPSIGHSIVEIMTRSQNHELLLKCKRLLRIARSHHQNVLQSCNAALCSCTDDDASSDTSEKGKDDLPVTHPLTDEQILCESMEQLFRTGVRQRRFKPAATPQFVTLPQDDDNSLLPCVPDAGADDEAPWVELPEIATSPCAPDPSEDMDVFATENWLENGMWRLHGMGTGVGKREADAQSDESLISASTPLATITTRSPQACSYALYHHLDDEYCKPDPAALAYVEDPGTQTRSPSHAHQYSHTYEQVTQEQVDAESFETLDSCSERDEMEDSDSMILFWLDENDVDAPRACPDGADADLDWL